MRKTAVLKEFCGHSGCRVLLCRAGRFRFVRKVSASPQYNGRLRRQMDKQARFANPTIRTPHVIDCGERDGLFFFDMEHIEGLPLHAFMTFNTMHVVAPLFRQLVRFVRSNQDPCTVDMTGPIEEKLTAVARAAELNGARYRTFCLEYDWSEVPAGYCHGDLTFENILVVDGELCFVDFLDSFLETPFVDLSKLMQDLLIMWSWRKHSRRPFVKNIQLYDELLGSMSGKEHALSQRLLVLNLLRALPYAWRPEDRRFLAEALDHLADRFSI